MTLKEIMTTDVQVVAPDCKLIEAAQKMRDLDVGAVPVCDGERLIGVITDRDIVVRGIAEGLSAQDADVRSLTSGPVVYAFEDDSVENASKLMQERRIRRLPVINREKRLVGIVALADLALKGQDAAKSGETIQKVSEPAAGSAKTKVA
jgi:CBS domain-containing protein